MIQFGNMIYLHLQAFFTLDHLHLNQAVFIAIAQGAINLALVGWRKVSDGGVELILIAAGQ